VILKNKIKAFLINLQADEMNTNWRNTHSYQDQNTQGTNESSVRSCHVLSFAAINCIARCPRPIQICTSPLPISTADPLRQAPS